MINKGHDFKIVYVYFGVGTPGTLYDILHRTSFE